ncbi:MAG: S8 family peptidase [Acidimicrobiales bacterium]
MPAQPKQPDQRAPAVDHPSPLGALATIFHRRNIAVGEASDGSVLLVRPDSVVFDAPRNEEEQRRLDELVDRNQLAPRERTTDERLGIVVADVPDQPLARIRGEPRWSLDGVNGVVGSARTVGLSAEYNHVVIGAQTVNGSPLGAPAAWAGEMAFVGRTIEHDGETLLLTLAEPSAQPPVMRQPLRLEGHTAPRVLILDSGLRTVAADRTEGSRRRPEHPALQDIQPHPDWKVSGVPGDVDDEDEPFDPPPGVRPSVAGSTNVLDFEAGHGTFIAGVIRQTCPDADITAKGVLSSFGDGDVAGVLESFATILHQEGPFDVVVMSFGANLVDDEAGLFGRELTTLLGDHTLGIAAAGNQSTCRPYFPAALPGIIGVGGLAADGKAWFTNFGGWVDACAPAVDVVSTFFSDFTETIEGKEFRRYEQWARWSGTSFAAPKVAAVVAQEMYLNQVSPKEAWKRLNSHRQFRYPDLGVVFNV